MAVKWIENFGSHSSKILSADDILDGFEILHLVIEMLYEKDSDQIKKLSKKINKRRGPIKSR